MPTNGFGADFFDRILGTAGDALSAFVGELPAYPDVQAAPSSYIPGTDIDPFLDLPNYSVGITGGSDPFADALQQSINTGRVQREMPRGQATTAASYGQGGYGQNAQLGPYNGKPIPQGELTNYATQMAQKYGVPPELFVRQINQESGFNPNARNAKSGAAGIAQFMPGTAAQYGVNTADPYSSLEGAARHMSDLYKMFGSWELALAAYNAGAGNVRQYGGIPPFAETQTYVRNIMGR